jgi:hypothetical protein
MLDLEIYYENNIYDSYDQTDGILCDVFSDPIDKIKAIVLLCYIGRYRAWKKMKERMKTMM